MPSSDAFLVRRALDDRPEAFEQLVLRYQKKAHAIARAVGVPGATVDDVVQEAFLKAFENLPHLRSPGSFGPWFLNIARNAARSCVQDLRRRAPAEIADGPGECEPPALEREELREVIWRQVAALPEAVREAVFLYYHEGESVRLVAKTLGTSRAAVLKRLERGRNLLREKLWRELEDSIREMLPSTREWRRKGRQLTILLLGAAATSWGIRAAPAAAAAAAGGKAIGSGWPFKLLSGGIEMAAKKHGIAIGLALFMLAGGLYVFLDPFGGGKQAAGPRALVAPAPGAAPTLAGGAGGAERQDDAAAGVDSNDGQAATIERPASIFGRVTDASGKGIAGARVIALPAHEWDAMVTSAAADLADPGDGGHAPALRAAAREFARRAANHAGAKTDAGGGYRLHDLADGEYRVIGGHEAHRPRTDGWALVRSGEPFRLDLELAEGWAIGGRVVDEAGRPVPGAAVVARPSGDRLVDPRWKLDGIIAGWAEGGFLLAPGRTASNEEGAFLLGSLELLPQDLLVEKEGYAPARLLDVAAGAGAVEVVLAHGLSIRGRVLDPRRQPLEEAQALLVILQASDEDIPPDYDHEGMRKASAAAGGSFEFSGLAPGLFEVSVSRRGFPVRRQEVRLEKTSADLGDLVLDSPRAIAGRVLDSRGAPLAGARVWVEAPVAGGVMTGRWGWRGFDPPVIAEARTGVGGGFHLEGLGEGAYTVHATSGDHAPASLSEVVAGGNPIEIRLQDGASFEGVVLDAVGGFPVADAEVTPGRGLIPDLEKQTISDPDGRFIIRGVTPDDRRISLTVTHKDYPWQPSEARWDPGHLGRKVEVLLFPAERIEGTVRDAAGNPVAGAQVGYEVPRWQKVFVHRVMGGLKGSARTGGDGSFAVEVPSLLRGIRFPHDRSPLELVAMHPALGIGRSAAFDAPLKGEPWPRVEIALLGTSSLKGKVTDERGQPVTGAVVLAARKASPEDNHAIDHGPTLTGSSNASAEYAIAGIEPGTYQVEVRAQGRPRTILDPVDVGAEPRLLDIALEPGTDLEGRVVDDAGLAVAEAEVFAREGMAVIASTRTDGGGRWLLAGLPERELSLGARAPGHEPSAPQVARPGEAPAALVLTRLSSLSGATVDSLTGRPVSSFEVFVSLASLGSAEASTSDTRGELLPREFTDPRGWFRIDDLRPGSFFVAVRARGFGVWAQRVTLAPGEDTAVRALLERGRILRGAVVDRETGLPIPNARVVCSRRGRRQEDLPCHITLSDTRVWTDGMGQFALPGLVPGEYSIDLHHPGYMPKDPARVAIGVAEPEFLRLGMLPAGAVQGKLENLEGRWSIALMLVLKRIDGESGGDLRCHPEPNGRFHFTSVLPGTYRVELGNYQWKAGEQPQIVRIGEALGEVVIRAGENAVFHARVP